MTDELSCSLQVTRKLAGADAGTAHCMTSVGNELGQVLMSVLTPSAEDFGLMDMAKGLQKRYQQAGRDPPQVLYVDRGCCSRDGGTCTAAALFPEWPQLLVRLDVRRFICRLAAGVTSPTHCLYQHFMQRVLVCIFEWDPEDLSLLREAKQADQSRRGSMLTVKEMSRHCRRRTRGTQETERLLGETLQALMGATDTTGIPLLQKDQMEEIWSAQRKHIACIQVWLHPSLQFEIKILILIIKYKSPNISVSAIKTFAQNYVLRTKLNFHVTTSRILQVSPFTPGLER